MKDDLLQSWTYKSDPEWAARLRELPGQYFKVYHPDVQDAPVFRQSMAPFWFLHVAPNFNGWVVIDNTCVAWGKFKPGESYPERLHIPYYAKKACPMVWLLKRMSFDNDLRMSPSSLHASNCVSTHIESMTLPIDDLCVFSK